MQAWAVKFYLWQNSHKLEADGVTVSQTAKDKIGKLLTSYMRKTIFDNWYMGPAKGPHLRVSLPIQYSRHGLTSADLINISDILEEQARDLICAFIGGDAARPGISRALAIREYMNMFGISDDEYDYSHFRRYFDRYAINTFGKAFPDFRHEVTRTLKEIYDPMIMESGVPE